MPASVGLVPAERQLVSYQLGRSLALPLLPTARYMLISYPLR